MALTQRATGVFRGSSYKVWGYRDEAQIENGEVQAMVLLDEDGNVITSFGGPGDAILAAAITESTYSVTSTSGIAVAANASRINGFIQNIGTNTVAVSTTATAVYANNMRLPPGGTLRFDQIIPGRLYTGALTAICNTALTSTLFICQA